MSKEYQKDKLDYEITKLDKQLDLLSKMAKIYEDIDKYKSNADKYADLMSKKAELERKLELEGIKNLKTLNDLDEKALEIGTLSELKRREYLRTEQDIAKEREKTIKDNEKLLQQEQEKLKQKQKQAEQDEKEAINRIANYKKQNEQEEKIFKRRQELYNQNKGKSDAEINQIFKNDKTLNKLQNNDTVKDILNQIKVGNSNVGRYVEASEKGTSAKMMVLQTFVDTFNKAVQIFSDSVKKGFQNQTGSYESNFTNIAVRTGMSKSSYRNSQMALGGVGTNLLHEQGLMNNIRTSDVQNMWNTLSERGFSQEDVLANSIETVITNTLVPYLDTTTTEMQLFNQNVGNDGLLKQVRGISKIAQEEYDNNIIATQYLQDQLNYLAPMSSVAEIDLMESTATGQFMLQSMLDKGMSLDSIAELQRNTRIIQDDVYGALNSNNLSVKMGAMNAVTGDVNTYTDYGGTLKSMIDSTTNLASLYPSNSFQSSILSSSWGMNGRSMYEISQLIKQGKLTDLDADFKKAQQNASKLGVKGQEVTNSLANDEFHTTRQLTDILAENLTNEVSAFAEMLGPWFDVLTTALKGIAAILGVKLAGKALGGIGNMLGIGGKAAGGGIISSALTSFAGTGVGYNLMGSGASLGINSVAGATAAGIAGVAGGGAMAVKGGLDVYNDIKEGDVNGKTALSAGGAIAGAAGAGLLLASNPIGWAALAVGGLALGARKLVEIQEETTNLTQKNVEEYQKMSDKEMEKRKELQRKEIDQLYAVKDRISDMEDLDNARQLLIESGIATEEELNDSKYNSKKALEDLTQAYIDSQEKFNQASNEITSIIDANANRQKGEMANKANSLLKDKVFGGAGWNWSYEDLNDNEKAMIKGLSEAITSYGDGKNLTGNEKKIYDAAASGDMNSFIDEMDWHNNEAYTLIRASLRNDNIASSFTTNKNVQSYLGIDKSYIVRDPDKASSAWNSMLNAEDADSARAAINKFKDYSGIKNINDLTEDLKVEAQAVVDKYSLGSFRVGTDSIPYDNYPALLHEGEAVLTASTANELRSLVDEYRETKNESTRLEKAIQDQTAALIQRLDAIYQKMPTNYESDPSSIMPGNLKGNDANITQNVRSMRALFTN